MSEHYAYVACSCFRDHLTSQPPVPRSALTFDSFGNVIAKTSRSADDDDEALRRWRERDACPHEDMRLIEKIWDAGEWDSGAVGEEVIPARYPMLYEVLDRSVSFGDATVLATPAQAKKALGELRRLELIVVPETVCLVIDEEGRPVSRHNIPPDGVVSLIDVGPTYGASPEPRNKAGQLLTIDVKDGEFIVRRFTDRSILLRARSLAQIVGDDPEARSYRDLPHDRDAVTWNGRSYSRLTLSDPASGASVDGYGRAITVQVMPSVAFVPRHGTFPAAVTAARAPAMMSDDSLPLGYLGAFLEASVHTQNPLVGYYSGHQPATLDQQQPGTAPL
jgi:hypothetical protein